MCCAGCMESARMLCRVQRAPTNSMMLRNCSSSFCRLDSDSDLADTNLGALAWGKHRLLGWCRALGEDVSCNEPPGGTGMHEDDLGGGWKTAMLLGLDHAEGAAFPPTAEAGPERESFLVKMGAGLGVPGLCEGYLTTKLGRVDSAGACVLPTRATGLLRRGVQGLKGSGLGLCVLAAGDGDCEGGTGDAGTCSEAADALRYRFTAQTLSGASLGEGARGYVGSGACAGV